jgi:hypothetical protein
VTELLRQFRWLEPAVDVARLGVFATFVGLGLAVALRGEGDPAARRRAVSHLVLYVLGVTVAVGLVQVESWPFTTWALVHGVSPARMRSWELEGLDGQGRGYPIDPAVFQPLAPVELGARLLSRTRALPPEGQVSVARFVLERAERARSRFRAGRRFAPNEWVLGPLALPYVFRQPRLWRSPADVPDTPFVALRIWVLEWDVRERFLDERRVSRRLLVEVRDLIE